MEPEDQFEPNNKYTLHNIFDQVTKYILLYSITIFYQQNKQLQKRLDQKKSKNSTQVLGIEMHCELKEHCGMKIQFCINECSGPNGDNNLTYATIGSDSINLFHQMSDADSCDHLVQNFYVLAKKDKQDM